MRRIRSVTSLALAIVALGCFDPVAVEEDGILVRAVHGQIDIRNSRSRTVFFFMLERELAARALWAPCVDPENCPRVLPGETLRLSRGTIGGITDDSREAILFWWHLVPDGEGGFEPEEIRGIVFPVD